MPSLENLSHAEFGEVLADLQALRAAGEAALAAGRQPTYCIAPGYDIGLTIGATMPEACDAHAELFAPRPPSDAIAPAYIPTSLGTLTFPSPRAEQTPADAPPVACEAAAGGAAEAFTFAAGADLDHPNIIIEPAAPLSSSLGEAAVSPGGNSPSEGGGAEGQASPEPAADPIQTEAREKPLPDGQSPAEEGGGEAGSSPATASETSDRPTWNNAWTDEHQDELVEGMAHAIFRGKAFTAAAHSMADELGRSGQACFIRAHQRLRPRIEARIAELKAGPPSQAPAPSAPAIAAGVLRHLDDLPRLTHGRRWTEAEDADLLRCVVNGMKVPEISADLQLDAGKIKARIAELTRTFSAEKMLAALKARLPQAAE